MKVHEEIIEKYVRRSYAIAEALKVVRDVNAVKALRELQQETEDELKSMAAIPQEGQ